MQTIDVFSKISDIPQEEWDRLIRTNVFATHGWLRTVEATYIGDIRPFYILVREEGRSVGATVCYIFSKNRTVVDLDDHLFGRVKPLVQRLGISFMPTMVCGTLWGCGDHLAVESGANSESRFAVMTKLLDVVEGEARRKGLPINLIDVPEEDLDLAVVLRRRGYSHSRHVPTTFLDICWSSFKEYEKYLDGVSRHARKNLRNQVNRSRKNGTTISILENIGEERERLHELITMNYRKYWNFPFCFSKDFYSELKRNLSRNAVLHISRKADFITGGHELRYNGTSYIPLVGIDHEKCGNDMTYFVLHPMPIAEAISAGMTRLYFGQGHYLNKMRLASGRQTSSTGIKPPTHCTPDGEALVLILSNWNRYKLPRQVRLPR
jgi:predicted N-acyltransferase